MLREKVYKDRDNTNDFVLYADGVAVDLSGVTKMELVFDGQTISSATSPDVFTWSSDGKLVLSLGSVDLEVGQRYAPKLVVYDAVNTNGVDWGIINLYVA